MAEVMTDSEAALETAAVGSSLEAIAGAIAVALAILALANVYPPLLLAIAVIVLGAGLLARGGAIAAGYTGLGSAGPERRGSGGRLGVGSGLEMVTGFAGIVLGILALLGVAAETMASVAVIVLAVGVVVNTATNLRIDELRLIHAGGLRTRARRWTMRISWIVQIALALVAIVLSIWALLDAAALDQLAALALGVAAILAGIAVGGQVTTRAVHR